MNLSVKAFRKHRKNPGRLAQLRSHNEIWKRQGGKDKDDQVFVPKKKKNAQKALFGLEDANK